MGQKTHPLGFRLGITKPCLTRWYSKNEYATLVREDVKIRAWIKGKLYHAGISAIEIERTSGAVRVKIHTARPGLIIGKKGTGIDALQQDLIKLTSKTIDVDIIEVRRPEANAQLVAESIALQIERRIAFRRAMKKAVTSASKFGIQGIKVRCAGRLAGSEIARSEWYREGKVPLHTLRADVDYGFAEALTTYGKIGVQVWLNHGEILKEKPAQKFI